MEKISMKDAIYICISNILTREGKDYAKLNEIYEEVSNYLEVENNKILQSQIRGRLQECCEQYVSFTGESLFVTERIRSGNWSVKKNILRKSKAKKKYIRYLKNTFLVSSDNWATVKKEISISNEYILEDNLDLIYRGKLIQKIGVEKANVIIAELNKIRKLLMKLKGIDKINDGYGTAFEVFAIATYYNIDYEECINKYIVHGDYDGKIDAIYYGEDKNIYVYQIKIGNIDDEAYDKMKLNYDICIKNQIPKDGKDLYNFITTNRENFKYKKVVFNSVSDNSKRLSNINPEKIYEMFFDNKLLPISKNNIILTIKKPTILLDGNFNLNVSTDENNNFSFYISAKELIDNLLRSLGIGISNYDKDSIDISKYFSDNVRGVLSVNKKMISTIENEPQNFVKYNNGVSITGEVDDLGLDICIKNPVINNGQQTITTLIRTNKNLDKIVIPVKITNETDMIIKGKISQFSNDQVKVKSIDMLSLNPHIRNIQAFIFKNKYKGENYFLEIYSSGKKSYYDIIKKLYKSNNIIDLLDFIKLYFSILNKKELGQWKNSPNIQVEKTIIDSCFDNDLSFKVCESIKRYEDFIENIENKKEKDDFKSADLAFKYLLCKENLDEEAAKLIIKNINKKYYYDKQDEKSKLIDLYKSSTIIDKLEKELQILKHKKVVS